MNGNNVVRGQLVQKLEQTTPNSSTVQYDQSEWSQCGRGIWTAGSKVGFSKTRVKFLHLYLFNFSSLNAFLL